MTGRQAFFRFSILRQFCLAKLAQMCAIETENGTLTFQRDEERNGQRSRSWFGAWVLETANTFLARVVEGRSRQAVKHLASVPPFLSGHRFVKV